jgi:glutathione peroxidase
MRQSLLALSLLVICGAANACSDLLKAEFRPLAAKDGEAVSLCDAYAGKVLLIVNTASKCGLTPQYDALEKLNEKYKDRGFAVLGFPSNDFMGQEPGTEADIKEFCTLTYGVKFDMFEKVSVKKGKAHPFYDQLAAQSEGRYPGWNFYKYIIGRDGKVAADFPSKMKPDDEQITTRIEALLETK